MTFGCHCDKRPSVVRDAYHGGGYARGGGGRGNARSATTLKTGTPNKTTRSRMKVQACCLSRLTSCERPARRPLLPWAPKPPGRGCSFWGCADHLSRFWAVPGVTLPPRRVGRGPVSWSPGSVMQGAALGGTSPPACWDPRLAGSLCCGRPTSGRLDLPLVSRSHVHVPRSCPLAAGGGVQAEPGSHTQARHQCPHTAPQPRRPLWCSEANVPHPCGLGACGSGTRVA